MTLPRYVTLAQAAEGVTKYRYNPPQDAVVHAVNLGYDADTVGAVTGMLAGRVYGYSNIPKRWLKKLVKHDELLAMAETLYALGGDDGTD